MRGFSVASAAMAASLFVSGAMADLDPIVIKGSKFFYKTNGTQFFMKGVAYQQDYQGGGSNGNGSATASSGNTAYTDPLADETSCKRDIPYLQQLQTNTIRVYAVDPTQNHDACMQALADAGIYVIADLSAPVSGQSINRADPSWDTDVYARYTSVVDSLQKYTNTLGFFAGNEVANQANNTDSIAFVKAAVRDTKAYIKAQGYRALGVGYASDDDSAILMNIADYLNCGDSSTSIDFFGYNIYSWCGDATFESSNYEQHTKDFSSYNVPVFFAEYGCNKVEPRTWGDTKALFSSEMTGVWSGGIVYMYFQEANDYGLVTVSNGNVTPNTDFTNLKSVMANDVNPTGVQASSYSPTNTAAQSCPTEDSNWNAVASPLPPSPNADLCSCMVDSLSCAVKSGTPETDFGDNFDYICGHDNSACNGIANNGSSGTYGAYGMCNPTQKLSFVMNQYYNDQKAGASACDFGGAGATKSSSSPSGTCSSLINQAGTAGTGTVTSSPTAKAGSSSSSSSSSGSSSSASAGAAGINSIPSIESGLLPVALVVVVGIFSGVGMIAFELLAGKLNYINEVFPSLIPLRNLRQIDKIPKPQLTVPTFKKCRDFKMGQGSQPLIHFEQLNVWNNFMTNTIL
ncbi:Hypothetical protein R9X50_00718400 [Acrodontium crateriforme]|uniref:1,3-beta-glucanosyltransferase n=1 Tax=Acrodontium crateriforme TaxID=150365 RepID=A0AAQ3MAY7_9PEZI|nr:Hypothetical protein R9X50_00718400 [Acrodontium crateriforme]